MANNPNLPNQPPVQTGLGNPNEAPRTPYQLSPEDIRTLQECNRESFFQRSLPLSTIFAFGTFYAVKSGYLKPNPRWGATPKILAAITCGYIIGKISYRKICEEKFISNPDSPLGEMLRKKYGGANRINTDPGLGQFRMETNKPTLSNSNAEVSAPQYDIDSDRPHPSGLDDNFRPSVDQENSTIITEELPASVPVRSTSYEELRAKNRQDYEAKKSKAYRGTINTDEIPTGVRRMTEQSNQDSKYKKENKYGDVWED